MSLARVSMSVFGVVAVLAATLAGATIWLLVTDPVTVADAVSEGDVREAERQFVSRVFLRRLGATFVERAAARRGVEDSEAAARLAQAGRSLVYFPEGRMTRAHDAAGFHLGAFLAASRVPRPVVPIALRGTRRLLPPDRWLPQREPIDVYVGAPLRAADSSWRAALALRDESYRWIAAHRSRSPAP